MNMKTKQSEVGNRTKLQFQKESKFHLSCTFLQGFCNYFKDLHQLSGQVLLLLLQLSHDHAKHCPSVIPRFPPTSSRGKCALSNDFMSNSC
jgi:hypothetical protein